MLLIRHLWCETLTVFAVRSAKCFLHFMIYLRRLPRSLPQLVCVAKILFYVSLQMLINAHRCLLMWTAILDIMFLVDLALNALIYSAADSVTMSFDPCVGVFSDHSSFQLRWKLLLIAHITCLDSFNQKLHTWFYFDNCI